MRNIIAVVPMKLNNRRLPQKNTKAFKNGKPLCYYILSTLLEIKEIEEVYVYCSNPEIKNYIPNRVKYLKRSETLDKDSTKINEVLSSFSKEIEANIYVMAHTTAPFITKESIKKGIQAVLNNGYDSSFSANKVQEFLWENNKPFNYELDNIPRTQDLDMLYKETSGFYIYKKNVINDMNRRIGDNPCVIEVSKIESIDIDEQDDFIIADAIYNYNFKNN